MTTVSVRYIVNDIDAAIEFYTTRLRFELQMRPNDLFAMLRHGDLRLVLVRPAGPDGPAGGGAPIIIEDPSGNPVELFEPILREAKLSRPAPS
jgi:catechol 2,3-dioxygenase-like lactoylglutathione lyase family enzyme